MENPDQFYYEKRLINERLNKLEDDIQNIKRGFPKSEIGEIQYMGHRLFHEAAIQAELEQTAFWRDLRTDLVKKGTWSVIIIVLGLMVNGIIWKIGALWKS